MATNGAGALLSREADMEALARLPRAVRDLLNEAPLAISAENAHAIKRRLHLDDDELLNDLKDRIAAVQENATREVYPEHPQLGDLKYDKWPARVRHRIHRKRRA